MSSRRTVAVVAGLLGAGLLMIGGAGPAAAGTTDAQLFVSKQRKGGYEELIGINLQPGKTKTYYLRVTSAGEEASAGFFGDQVAPYKFKYFKLNGKNITPQATSPEGFGFTIGDGRKLLLRGKVKLPAGDDPNPACSIPEIDWVANDDAAFVSVNSGTC